MSSMRALARDGPTIFILSLLFSYNTGVVSLLADFRTLQVFAQKNSSVQCFLFRLPDSLFNHSQGYMEFTKIVEVGDLGKENPPPRGSPFSAVMTLAKGTLGVGLLALPRKAMMAGIPTFLVCLLTTGFLTVRSVEMIARGSRKCHLFVYEEITQQLLGTGVSILLGVSLLINCCGSSVIYIVAIGDSLQSLLVNWDDQFGFDIPTGLTILFGLGLSLLSLIKNLGSLWFFSLAGLIAVLTTVGAIAYTLYRSGIAANLSEPPALGTMDSIMRSRSNWMDTVGLVATATFALCNQYSVPQVLGELQDITENSIRPIAFASTAIPAIVYVITAIVGYLCYGFAVEDNIMKNFTPLVAQGDWVISIGIGAVILSVISCFIINTYAMKLSMLYLLPSSVQDSKWVQLCVPILISVTTVVFGIYYPNISSLLNLVGAATGSILCYIVPALISLAVHEQESGIARKGCSWFCSSLVSCPLEWFMIVSGIMLGTFGTVLELINCFGIRVSVAV